MAALVPEKHPSAKAFRPSRDPVPMGRVAAMVPFSDAILGQDPRPAGKDARAAPDRPGDRGRQPVPGASSPHPQPRLQPPHRCGDPFRAGALRGFVLHRSGPYLLFFARALARLPLCPGRPPGFAGLRGDEKILSAQGPCAEYVGVILRPPTCFGNTIVILPFRPDRRADQASSLLTGNRLPKTDHLPPVEQERFLWEKIPGGIRHDR